jgi:hypothetical protein
MPNICLFTGDSFSGRPKPLAMTWMSSTSRRAIDSRRFPRLDNGREWQDADMDSRQCGTFPNGEPSRLRAGDKLYSRPYGSGERFNGDRRTHAALPRRSALRLSLTGIDSLAVCDCAPIDGGIAYAASRSMGGEVPLGRWMPSDNLGGLGGASVAPVGALLASACEVGAAPSLTLGLCPS